MQPVISAAWAPELRDSSRPTLRIPQQLNLILLWTLVVFCVVAWRQGNFYTGGMDPVVVAKAVLQSLALGWAFMLWLWSDVQHPLGARSFLFLAPVLGLSVIGALAEGNFTASTIIAIRIVMLAVTIMLIMRTYPAEQVLVALYIALSLVGLVSTITGLALGGGGRLSGGIPPLSPNEIALLAGVPALFLLHQALRAQVRWWHLLILAALFSVLLLSESRTALAAAAVSAGLMVLLLRRIPLQTIVTVLLLAPAAFYLLFLTPAVENMMSRADSASILTLNSRTISWSVVLGLPNDSWQRWIGAGLSQKTIAVEGQYWTEQVFDSSWISLLAQAGIIGTGMVALWVLLTVFSAARSRRLRSLLLPLLAFVLIRSVMENGLVDAGVLFLVFFVMALMAERPSAAVAHDWDRDALLNRRRAKLGGGPPG